MRRSFPNLDLFILKFGFKFGYVCDCCSYLILAKALSFIAFISPRRDMKTKQEMIGQAHAIKFSLIKLFFQSQIGAMIVISLEHFFKIHFSFGKTTLSYNTVSH